MSSRVLAACILALAAACAAAGCSSHGARRSPAAATTVPGADLARGQAVYEAQCQACHGVRGAGGPVGPALRNENTRRSYSAVYEIVRDPHPPMPKLYPSRMTLNDLRDVTAYVESL